METIIGIEALKDEFRKAKLKCGDLRGLKNRFELSEKFGISSLETFFNSTSTRGGEHIELTADCYEVGTKYGFHVYSMKELIDEMKGRTGTYEVDLVCLRWKKMRTNSESKTVITFMYKNQP